MRLAPERDPWRIVAGSTLAIAVCSGPVLNFTFSLFIEPLTREFHWSRAFVSLGYAGAVVLTALTAPVVGRIIDRYSPRSVLLLAVPLFAASIALLSATQGKATYILLYLLAGLFSAAHSPFPHAKLIARWFDARRGLALGIAMSGVGIGAALLPQLARWLLESRGWRMAYLGLGMTSFLVAFPAVFFFAREPANRLQRGETAGAETGTSLGEALKDARFWRIALCVLLLSMVLNGSAAHVVPLLTSLGVPRDAAVPMIGILAVSSLAGRLGTGYLLDRVYAPFVTAAACLLAFAGIALLAAGYAMPAPAIALGLLGFSLGADMDVIGYLVSRYFGLRCFGAIYGVVFALFSISGAIGAPLMGLSFDYTHSYGLMLAIFCGALLFAAALIMWLGPYEFPPTELRALMAEDDSKTPVGNSA